MREADLTVSDAAKEIKKRREKVVALIESGALQGYDASVPGDKRKSYRIPREALDAFKAGRSAKQTKPAKRRARQAKPDNFVEYFK
jgi:excisionase family DNA binding protein